MAEALGMTIQETVISSERERRFLIVIPLGPGHSRNEFVIETKQGLRHHGCHFGGTCEFTEMVERWLTYGNEQQGANADGT